MQNEPGGQCKGSKARPIHFLRGFFLNVTEEAVSKILSKTTPSRETNGCDRRNWTPMHQAQLWQTLTHQNRIDFDPDSFTKSRCHALQVTGERDWDLASSWLVPWQWWQIPKNSQLYEHLFSNNNIMQYLSISSDPLCMNAGWRSQAPGTDLTRHRPGTYTIQEAGEIPLDDLSGADLGTCHMS